MNAFALLMVTVAVVEVKIVTPLLYHSVSCRTFGIQSALAPELLHLTKAVAKRFKEGEGMGI